MTRRQSFLLPFLLWLILAALRMAAPSTLDDKDQPKVAFYTSDIVERGRWTLQFSDGDDVATKPPLYQWTAAAFSLAVGRLNDFTLLFPSLVSGFFLLLIVWDWGRGFGRGLAADSNASRSPGSEPPSPAPWDAETFANSVACLAALVWVTTYHVQRLQWTARTDMMASAFGLGALWASSRLGDAHSANRRALWRWTFWALIALGALTKGHVPLAVALSALVAECILRRSLKPLLDLWPWFGLPMAAAVFAIWFFAAWAAGGKVFWDTLVGSEFLERVAGTGARAENARPIYYYIPVFVGRFLPWSVLFLLAIPRWIRDGLFHPARRHPLLPPMAWTIGIFLVFSIPRGKRPDYVLPMYAPAAIMVAALLHDWLRRGLLAFGWNRRTTRAPSVSALSSESTSAPAVPSSASSAATVPAVPRSRRPVLAGLFALAAAGSLVYFFFGSEAAHTHAADRTRRFGLAARAIIDKSPGPIVYCDPKSSLLQFYLRTNDRPLSIDETADQLRAQIRLHSSRPATGGKVEPIYVITRQSRLDRLNQSLGHPAPATLEPLLTSQPLPQDDTPLVLFRVPSESETPGSSPSL